jgi:hypothetical protein
MFGMSFENPGDGLLCDHCNRPGTPYEYRGIMFSGLHANRGERLCSSCLDRAVQADYDRPVGPMQVPARDYIAPIWEGSAKAHGYVRPKYRKAS